MALSGQFSKSQYNEYMKDVTHGLLYVPSDETIDYICDSDIFGLSGCQKVSGIN